MSDVVVARVPAKVNLHLEVIGKRPDGYHEVRTLLQSVDVWDEVRAEPAPEGTVDLAVEPAGAAPADERNLAVAATKKLWEHLGRRPGARLGLRKRIPVGAGMGGGSADAAATLVALDRLWGLGLGGRGLLPVAAALGSDVPFFLVGGLALGVGRGDEVIALPDPPPRAVVVVFPGVASSTAEVYGELGRQLTWHRPAATLAAVALGDAVDLDREPLVNDLQPVVCGRSDAVAEVLTALRGATGGVAVHTAVTGSGSAVFALPAAAADAGRIVRELDGRGWWVHRGRLLGRAEGRIQVRAGEEVR